MAFYGKRFVKTGVKSIRQEKSLYYKTCFFSPLNPPKCMTGKIFLDIIKICSQEKKMSWIQDLTTITLNYSSKKVS